MKHLILVGLMVVGLCHTAYAKIAKSERVLLVISELDSGGAPELEPLYTILERLTQVSVQGILSKHYSEVRIINNEKATLENFKLNVREFADNENIGAIDVILSLHGRPNELLFADKAWDVEDMKNEFLSANSYAERDLVSKMKKKLRIMYNMSCFGSSHNPSFYRMGFDVSTGSKNINANSEVEFVPTLLAWKNGFAFKHAFSFSNNPLMLFIADGPVRRKGRKEDTTLKTTNSKKLFYGFTQTKITTDPREVY